MMKCEKYLSVIVAILSIVKPLVTQPEKSVRLDNVKSSIALLKAESDISFDSGFYRGLRAEDYDEEIDILSLGQLRRLARFAKKNLPEVFEAPRIVMQVKADFVKQHKMIIVRNVYPSARHTKELVFIIHKDGSKIYRFGRFDAEASEIICNLAREEIERFNAFIRKENLAITDPGVALEVFQLYLTLARQREIHVIDRRDDIAKKIGAIGQDMKGISGIPRKIDSPIYCRTGDIFRIIVSTYAISGNTLSIDYWDVSVNKNGVIKPNSNEYFRW